MTTCTCGASPDGNAQDDRLDRIIAQLDSSMNLHGWCFHVGTARDLALELRDEQRARDKRQLVDVFAGDR